MLKYYKHPSIKVRVLKCDYPEFVGKIVDTYCRCANGVDFVTRYGLVFLDKDKHEYEEV